ncbi:MULTISPECIES: D-alanyl-D-alanine carboxypeptidase family protein [Shouchella]|uniref:serine-type D-Ala-D-Ala carboxypeptidase n=2 Tax=Shouchella TaxID=2893057 RepID=A0ABY7W8X0_9BACI|nr:MULTISPECIES: D-alanyl-D-alanine carboxypeptidase family protein [Shouchella]MED4126964.1 D-alanyl-D-alanine carboxypeptidase [Shouchella miscanthi]WDF05329.1 D-alanyl-D-alanine carboxypeptidase [Shouchella hunanensis]
MKRNNRAKWARMSLLFTLILALVTVPYQKAEANTINVDASAAIMINGDTGQILYEDNIDEQLAIASMTKMMTEYLLFEAIEEGQVSWDDTVTIEDHLYPLSHQGGLSNVMLRSDYDYTVKDLYESMAIYSANASTMALASHIAGSESAFVQQMNEKAAELGLDHYDFVNSSGLPNSSLDGHHPDGTPADAETTMSARSVAQLAFHLLNDYPEVLETASIPFAEFQAGPDETVNMPNWNQMLPGMSHEYEGADGLKTGTTDAAGNSFTGTALRDGTRLITVVMNAGDPQIRTERFDETAKLFDYGFDQFEDITVVEEGQEPEDNTFTVSGGKETEVSVVTSENLNVATPKNANQDYTLEVVLDEKLLNENGELVAPISEGERIGTLKVNFDDPTEYIQGTQLSGVALVATEDIEEAGWFTMSMRGIGSFFSSMWTSLTDTVSGWFN